ncbi:MAG TPA: hypothetical protein DCM07_24400 [Planctomycetaceae bacterium]|uniref:hypothetical protein n=1 Tax=Gimesia sp. TaxID=2024833 RepID=UPI000C60E787|nr:hypothetical protein [Gimesia sp.]MAX40053.1 hypothetical protein [Gimesia sp.]HAH47937.1 hypothetical protein [Planctomycetaceae bacterium]HBL42712.1 hypothetical protein [Planctomycetaceae bacterium]|tara:strand:+ start:2022 stop:2309 length:288 start_codon:yes stop_codon:yes gene_type:complete
MTQNLDQIFEASNIVKYNGVRSDGCCEIICSKRFAQSILDALNRNMIPCGLDPDEPIIGDSAIIITSTMINPAIIKENLTQWMVRNHVGNIETVN